MFHPSLWPHWRSHCCWLCWPSSARPGSGAPFSGFWPNCWLIGEKPMRKIRILWQAEAVLGIAALIGCSSSDERYVELSQQSVARQAEQNQQIARQSQQVAEAAHELVQADARSRAELIEA